jgi:hypothetical protein
MSARRMWPGLALIAALIVSLPRLGICSEEARITVHFAPSRSPSIRARLFRTLNKFGQPEEVVLAPGRSLNNVLVERCGFAAEDLVNFVMALNGGVISTLQQERIIAMPPCPFWTARQTIEVTPELTDLRVLLHTFMGQSGPDTVARVLGANPSMRRNSSKLAVGDRIVLPYSSRSFSFLLRPEYVTAKEEVVSSLAEDFRSIVVKEPTADLQIDLVLEPQSMTIGNTSGCEAADLTWPFDRQLAWSVLNDNRARGFDAEGSRVLTVIADTGIARSDVQLFPLRQSIGEREVAAGSPQDRDGNDFPDDRFGAKMDPRGGFPAAPPVTYERSAHGTQVAGIAIGGPGTDALAGFARERLRLAIARIIKEERFAGSVMWRFTEPAVESSLHYARVTKAHILNWSIQGSADMPNVKFALATNSSLLAVIAAGNDYSFVDRKGAYPGSYVREFPDRIITVAALESPDGKIAEFSNFGAETVDLAAPGSCVPTFTFGGIHTTMDGTSAAAPLVSFTAALLMAQGLDDPELVKRRIVHTVRYDRRLHDVVKYSGWLDIPKALAIADDVIETVDPSSGRLELHRGRIVNPSETWHLCDEDIKASDLIRIIPNGSEDAAKPTKVVVREFENNSGRSTAARDLACEAPSFPIDFEERKIAVDGTVLPPIRRSLDWRHIVDVVPAYFQSNF